MKKFKKNVDMIMHYADADNNGVISFTEFFFFMTIIQMPDKLLSPIFDAHDPKGKMSS